MFRLFEIPRHAIPFRSGGRHNGASTRAINRRRGADTARGHRIRGDPERNKICRRQFCLSLWAEDRLTQHKRHGGCTPRDSARPGWRAAGESGKWGESAGGRSGERSDHQGCYENWQMAATRVTKLLIQYKRLLRYISRSLNLLCKMIQIVVNRKLVDIEFPQLIQHAALRFGWNPDATQCRIGARLGAMHVKREA